MIEQASYLQFGRVGGRGLAHILDQDRGRLTLCRLLVDTILQTPPPEQAVCRECRAAFDVQAANTNEAVPIEDRAAEEIEDRAGAGILDDHDVLTLAEASKVCGLAITSLQQAAKLGRLRTRKFPRLHLTTRSWLTEYLDSRPEWARRRTA